MDGDHRGHLITITAGASGGGRHRQLHDASNPGIARSATLSVAGQTFTVNQAAAGTPCAYQINPSSQSLGASGGPGTNVAVTRGRLYGPPRRPTTGSPSRPERKATATGP